MGRKKSTKFVQAFGIPHPIETSRQQFTGNLVTLTDRQTQFGFLRGLKLINNSNTRIILKFVGDHACRLYTRCTLFKPSSKFIVLSTGRQPAGFCYQTGQCSETMRRFTAQTS